MRPFLAIVKKELRSVLEERTIMIAVAIQLFIASFASVLVVGLVAFYDPDSIAENAQVGIRAGVVGDRHGVLTSLLQDSNVRVTRYPTAADARAALKDGSVDTALVIPGSAPEARASVVEGRLLLPKSESLSTVVMMVLRPPLKAYENHLRQQNGVQVRYTEVEGKPPTTYEFRYTVIVPILMLFPAFVSGSMVVDSISEEFERKTMETLRAAPLSMSTIIGAKVAAGLVLAVVQSLLWVLLLRVNRTPLQHPALILTLAAILAATVSMGSALVAIAFRERERSQFVYSITIPLVASVSYLLGASPTTLIARLATGDAYTGVVDVLLYAAPLLALTGALLLKLRRGVRP
jgi:ABC-type Na+ efflux pump permease subunit